MNPQLTVAQKSAFKASRLIKNIFEKTSKLSAQQRQDSSIFDAFFKQVETEIAQEILYAYPDHSVETKCAGVHGKADNKFYWYVSGIVGKENFLAHNSDFAISIAYCVEGKLMAGLVFKPIDERSYMAVRSEGATANDVRIRLAKHTGRMEDAQLFTMIDADDQATQIKQIITLNENSLGVRISGDIALDICKVMSGEGSAVWVNQPEICDLASAILIAQEGGALVTNFAGEQVEGVSESLVVSPPKLLKPLLIALKQ